MGQALPIELRNTNNSKSGIDSDLLKAIYEVQYTQSVKEADPSRWQFQIQLGRQLCGAETSPQNKLRLSFDSLPPQGDFDLVIAATGYERNQHKQLLAPLTAGSLLDGPELSVDREYRVNLRSGVLAPGCGLWLQGSFADGDDVSLPADFSFNFQRALCTDYVKREMTTYIPCSPNEGK